MHQSAKHLVSVQNSFILLALLALCLVAGSLVDYPLSCALINQQNPFGLLLAAYGHFPAFAAISLAGVLFICTYSREKPMTSALLALLGVSLNAICLFAMVHTPLRYLSLSIPVAIIIGVSLLVLVNVVLLFVLRGATHGQLQRFGAFLLAFVVAQFIVVYIIKIVWSRPRMRMIVSTDGATFQPWWVIGSEQKDGLMATGIAAEEFKSFPSGHTACAACAMALVALPAIKPALARWSNVLFWASALIPALVAISRIIMGAHFLTDVTMGFTTTFLILLVLLRAFYGSTYRKPPAEYSWCASP